VCVITGGKEAAPSGMRRRFDFSSERASGRVMVRWKRPKPGQMYIYEILNICPWTCRRTQSQFRQLVRREAIFSLCCLSSCESAHKLHDRCCGYAENGLVFLTVVISRADRTERACCT
jgi:hypothetical protein